MWRDDPATTMVIGWEQASGDNPVLYFDIIDFGTQAAAYRNQKRPDRITYSKGMNNHFVRLSGLEPNTVYYFVIKDSDHTSQRMSFKTAPDDPNVRLSIVAGGDSRNNRDIRRNANSLVSKLRPHFVVFAGDMTGGDTNENWRDWFDDWQYTIGSDGRLFPIVPARGNHERENGSITELFDVPGSDVYYALTFGGNLLRLYTLNSLISPSGKQRIWLEGDLKANERVTWKMAQYHQGMRPHTSRKASRDDLYSNWANLFYDHRVNLVVESDAHVVKTTYPLRPQRDGEDGFVRDNERGTVYIGEGCWGAPLRDNDRSRSWTRASGSFNQFKWIFIDQQRIEVRTIKTDRVHTVAEVSHDDIFNPPKGIVIWNPPTGDVLTIDNPRYQPPAFAEARPPAQAPQREQPQSRMTRPQPAGKPAAANDGSNPDDPNDWSGFPKVQPDAQGTVRIKYILPNPGTVSIKLIKKLSDGNLKLVTNPELPSEPAGEAIKSLDLSGISRGEYLIVVMGNGKLVKRFRVVK